MLRFLTFLIVLVIAGALVYGLGDRNGASLRSLTAPSVSISDLLKSASDYEGKVVKTSGVVSGSVGVLGAGAFRLRDSADGSEIAVIASSGIPPEGTAMTITGKFKQALVIGNFQYAVIVLNF